jgi:hypothetical protein
MNSSLLPWVAASSLILFAAVAALDGVWIHLWKLRLFARPTSYMEHLWHTASAVLFVPTVALLFAHPSAGPTLWLALALLVAIHVVEVFDVLAERESRRDLGGLSRFELSVHVVAVGSRTVAIAALLAARPGSIWIGDGASAPLPAVIARVGEAVAMGAVGIAVVHIVLAVLHCPVCTRWCTRPPAGAHG